MDGPKSFFQKLVPLLPALRFPLLLNNLVAMTLAWVARRDVRYLGSERRPIVALAITLIISMLQNLLLSAKHLQNRRIKLVGDRYDFQIIPIITAATDLAFGINFLVLFIVNTVLLASQSWFYSYSHVVVTTYAAFGALIACIFHSILAVVSFYLLFQAYRKDRPRCPTCQQHITSLVATASAPSPKERSGQEINTVANEEGESAGDRLITPGPEE